MKKQNKTKEQIAEEIKKTQKLNSLRSFAKSEFIPLMKEISTDIEHSKIFSSAISMAIEQVFNKKRQEVTVSELNITEQLNDSEEGLKYKKMLELLADKSIADVMFIFDEFVSAIENKLRNEQKTRKLEELNLEAFDEIKE